jgi:CheY-like chemotaxis protein
LLVDDNFDMREYITRLLSHKYKVIRASDGASPNHPHLSVKRLLPSQSNVGSMPHADDTGLEALGVLRSSPQAVDLVLTDVMMPFLDGFGLLKEIRY